MKREQVLLLTSGAVCVVVLLLTVMQIQVNQVASLLDSTQTLISQAQDLVPESGDTVSAAAIQAGIPQLLFTLNGQSSTDRPITIEAGSTVRLAWSSLGATSCSAGGSNSFGWAGGKKFYGSQTLLIPIGSSIGQSAFTLLCSNRYGTASRTILVNVVLPPPSAAKPLVCGSVGDIDGNNLISDGDREAIIGHILSGSGLDEAQKKDADLNNNGVVSTLDITYLTRYLNGSISTFPKCVLSKPLACGFRGESSAIGDVNRDGRISENDSERIRSAVLGLTELGEENKKIADVNGDGSVNTADIAAINRYIRGLDRTLPACLVSKPGSLSVTTDSSSPTYQIAAGGTNGVTAGVFKFHATNEGINLRRVVLKLTSGLPRDIVEASLWDGNTQVGRAYFTGSNRIATSTLSTVVLIPKDSDKQITVKVDLSNIGIAEVLDHSGDLVKVDYYPVDATGTYGTGAESGQTIKATGSTAVAGIRVMKSYPTVALDTLPTNGVAGSNIDLLRFRVTASPAGGIGIGRFIVGVTSSGATVRGVNIFGFTDSSYSSAISGLGLGGKFMPMDACETGSTSCLSYGPEIIPYAPLVDGTSTPTTVQIPAGATRYFAVRATTVLANAGVINYWVTATIPGELYFDGPGRLDSWYTSRSYFIWSPNSITTSTRSNRDWFNGFGVPGLPSSGLTQTRNN